MFYKKIFAAAFALAFGICTAHAGDAVFSQDSAVQEIKLKPVSAGVNPNVGGGETNAVNTQPANSSLSAEKFKSAVNNLESAQVDVREQLATYKALVAQKQSEFDIKKAELTKLKKEYSALQKKMKNIEKMKKMINSNIEN